MVTRIRAATRPVSTWHARIVALALLVLLVGGSFQLLANLFAANIEGNGPVEVHAKAIQYRSSAEWLRSCTSSSAPFFFGVSHHVYLVRCEAAKAL